MRTASLLSVLTAVLGPVLVLLLAGCPSLLAPPPSAGASAGGACQADLDCANGLACECGLCAEPSGQAPRCIALDDACGDVPSDCFAACGDPTVVGQAECAGGRETCAGVNGVLESQCPEDTCWGEAQPGEICLDGEYECQFPPRAANGQCYTFDCDGAAGGCVGACGDGSSPTSQVCLASEWQCESGVPASECGECVGVAPSCVLTCDDLTPVGSAACAGASLEWSCAHIVQNGTPATVSTDCCATNPDACPDAGPADDDAGLPELDAGLPDAGRPDGGDGGGDDGGPGLSDGGGADASAADGG